jgi:hypothetical protein
MLIRQRKINLIKNLIQPRSRHLKGAARVIISGIKRNKRRILIGPDALFFNISQRIFPALYRILSPIVVNMMGLGFALPKEKNQCEECFPQFKLISKRIF